MKTAHTDPCAFAQVCEVKEGLAGLGETVEEMRSVSRQLQSELRKLADCSQASFEAEADALMDSWLDVSVSPPRLQEEGSWFGLGHARCAGGGV